MLFAFLFSNNKGNMFNNEIISGDKTIVLYQYTDKRLIEGWADTVPSNMLKFKYEN